MSFTFIACTTICIVIIINLCKWLIAYNEFHNLINKIPGPKEYPIVGNVTLFLKIPREERWKWFVQFCQQYKDGIFRTWNGGTPFIHLTRPKHLEAILPSKVLIQKSFVYDFLNLWLGTGLLTSTGDKWRRHHKMIIPTFHFNILADYSIIMSEKADVLNECIAEEIEQNPGKPLDVLVLLTRTALDIICEAAMGVKSNLQKDHETEYSIALHNITKLTIERTIRPWLYWDFIYYRTDRGKNYKSVVESARKFTRKTIQERRIARENQRDIGESTDSDKPKRKAFLDHLLDACDRDGAFLSDDELREEVDTFTFAGHDTTATVMSFALVCIGDDPEIQEKIHQEQNLVFGDSTEPATFQDLSKLKYLECVIKETLRIFPSAPTISRAVTEDIEIDGYKVPPGTVVSIQIHRVHRDPEHWPDPEKFDPDRFLPENSQGRHPYAYIPFSAGPRNCIGQKFAMIEAKTVLTAVLRKWRVKGLLKRDELVCCNEIILRPLEGVKVYFTRR